MHHKGKQKLKQRDTTMIPNDGQTDGLSSSATMSDLTKLNLNTGSVYRSFRVSVGDVAEVDRREKKSWPAK